MQLAHDNVFPRHVQLVSTNLKGPTRMNLRRENEQPVWTFTTRYLIIGRRSLRLHKFITNLNESTEPFLTVFSYTSLLDRGLPSTLANKYVYSPPSLLR